MPGNDIAITVENLSKSYFVGHETVRNGGYQTLRDSIVRTMKGFGRKTLDMVHGRQIIQGDEIEEFWALKDVSFEVKRGEVVGIIGRNGAGKSTLLKVLSRITEPTEGRATIKGRVACLLEVGTGFHPELTGRENIYLNGAILGMTRREIKKKFDEIVAFAEVEHFLDTPVKRYSSGMFVRLAFAVAAHLEPEILVVDEVLAVGDAEFQKKCLGKMSEVAGGGRTVLFVSHNLSSLRAICKKGLVLSKGQVVFDGSMVDALAIYSQKDLSNVREYPEGSLVRRFSAMQDGDSIVLEAKYEDITGKMNYPGISFVIHDVDGRPIMGHHPLQDVTNVGARWHPRGIVRVRLRSPALLDGTYLISLYLGDAFNTVFSDPHCLTLTVSAMVHANYQLEPNKSGPVYPACDYEFLDV